MASEFYIGPGQQYPMRDVANGIVIQMGTVRIYGQGPWTQAGS